MISFEIDGIEYRAYDHLYAVSQCGKVLRTFKPYTPRSNRKDGYLTLGRMRLMHRVVAICWVKNPENKTQVHHINENKTDNRACNLQWVTPKEHFCNFHLTNGHYIRTPETLEKYRVAQLGKKDKEETIAKKRVSLDLYRNKRACKYMGITYERIKDACAVAGISHGCFVVRCRSKNFPDYELV